MIALQTTCDCSPSLMQRTVVSTEVSIHGNLVLVIPFVRLQKGHQAFKKPDQKEEEPEFKGLT